MRAAFWRARLQKLREDDPDRIPGIVVGFVVTAVGVIVIVVLLWWRLHQ